jgi:hypothetical protein
VSLSVFDPLSKPPLEIANPAHRRAGGLPRYTGGQTYYYPSFNAARSEDALKFAHEFGTVISDPICLEAVMRVRASRGEWWRSDLPELFTEPWN